MFQATLHARAICSVVLALMLVPAATAQHYIRTDLTTDASSVSATAPNIDTNLKNAWGLARSTGSFWWVSDNGTGVSTLYDPAGVSQSLIVTIPPPPGQPAPSAPTGAVFNFTTAFELAPGKPAIFLFVTEDGTIAGWNPGVDATTAVIKVNHNGKASYKGVAIAQTPAGPRLYATNFETGRVEVYDGSFNPVSTGGFHFNGQQSQHGLQLVPFNIWNVGGNLVVTFAYKESGEEDESHGAGLGQVEVFNVFGRAVLRLEHGPWLNAPWGVAMSPSDFGAFPHRLLIGQFGDGTIQVYNLLSGKHEGTLLSAGSVDPIVIDGLWAISFAGDNAKNGVATQLYFTAGPNDENDGLFGKIAAVDTETRGNTE
jgi:uncharacterized protein (TIGR03118 family)